MLPDFVTRSFGSGGTQRSIDMLPVSKSVTRINSPGQRFTATHGITAMVTNAQA